MQLLIVNSRMNFRDIVQAVDGPRRGLLAQVIAVNNGEIELLSRSMEGVPTTFTVPESELAQWKPTGGRALLGPAAKIAKTFEPGSAPELQPSGPTTATPETTGSVEADSVQLPPEPLNVEELLEPLPPDVKAVPMNHDTPAQTSPPVWNIEEPQLTAKEKLSKRRSMKTRAAVANSLPKRNYTALVTNGSGQQTRIHYALREGLDPMRYVGFVVTKAMRVLPAVQPFRVTEIKEGHA